MGVKGLNTFIRNNAASGVVIKTFNDYANKTVCYDAPAIIFQIVIAQKTEHSDSQHIRGVLYKIMNNLKHAVLPQFVFDGIPPRVKKHTMKRRANIRNNAQAVVDEGNATEGIIKRSKGVNKEQIAEIQQMLTLLGIPYIVALHEADSQCAAMNIMGRVHHVASNDTDLLAYGAQNIVREFSDKKLIEELHLDTILRELDLTYEQFVELCIIFGTDYCEESIRISTNEAYAIYCESKDMNVFLETIQELGFHIPDCFLERWSYIKQLFMDTDVYNPTEVSVIWQRPNLTGLRLFLIKHGFSREQAEFQIRDLDHMYRSYIAFGRLCQINKHCYLG